MSQACKSSIHTNDALHLRHEASVILILRAKFLKKIDTSLLRTQKPQLSGLLLVSRAAALFLRETDFLGLDRFSSYFCAVLTLNCLPETWLLLLDTAVQGFCQC